MAQAAAAVNLYCDTLWQSKGGHYFRMWLWVTNSPESVELTNESTGKSQRYTVEQIQDMARNGKLKRIYE